MNVDGPDRPECCLIIFDRIFVQKRTKKLLFDVKSRPANRLGLFPYLVLLSNDQSLRMRSILSTVGLRVGRVRDLFSNFSTLHKKNVYFFSIYYCEYSYIWVAAFT